jgi:branched-chain amino acid transport system substrate-binding protein
MSAYVQRVRDAKPQAVFPREVLPRRGRQRAGVNTAMNYSPTLDVPMNKKLARDIHAADPAVEYPDFYPVAIYDVLQAAYKVAAAQPAGIDPDKTMSLLKGMEFDSARGPIQIDPQTRDIIQPIYIRRVDKVNGQLQNTTIATYPAVKDPTEK